MNFYIHTYKFVLSTLVGTVLYNSYTIMGLHIIASSTFPFQIIQDELGHHPSQTVKFYCFYRDSDSTLTDEMLKKVGIGSPSDVGNWLADTFDKLDQKDLATKLRNFVQNKDQ